MKQSILFWLLVFGFGLCCGIVSAEDGFYVIPIQVNKNQLHSPVAKTGQNVSHATGDDGEWEEGLAWPSPRFNDNGDGTVTDNLTKLIWLKDANCLGQGDWATGLSRSNSLNNGECGLTDGSVEGDWRLPNIKELQSLVHYGYYNPALPNTAGTGKWTENDPLTSVNSIFTLSSTTASINSIQAFGIYLYAGEGSLQIKSYNGYAWPVRRQLMKIRNPPLRQSLPCWIRMANGESLDTI